VVILIVAARKMNGGRVDSELIHSESTTSQKTLYVRDSRRRWGGVMSRPLPNIAKGFFSVLIYDRGGHVFTR
jgi:hypothetical protein